MGWFTVSTIDRQEVLFSNAHSGFLILIFCFSFLIGGGLLALLAEQKASVIGGPEVKKASRFVFLCLAPILVLSFYAFFKTCILVFIKGYSFSHIRHLFFAFPEGGNFWFSHKFIWSLFLILSGFVFHFLLVVSLPLFLFNKGKLLFITFLVFVFLETFTRMSRGLIYSIVVCAVFVLYMLYSEKRLRVNKKHLFFSGAGLIIIMIFLSLMRAHNPITGFIRYHTIGFMMLTKLIDKDYFFNSSTFTYGRMTLGGFDYLFGIFFRGLGDRFYQVPAYYNSFLENKLILLDLKVLGYNSFYTMLSSPYLDFGEAGVGIVGIIIGFFTTKFEYLYRKNNDVMALIWLLFIFYNCIMGIFGAVFEVPGFWLTLIGLVLFSNFVNFDRIKKSATEV